jgi:hypothetical protein
LHADAEQLEQAIDVAAPHAVDDMVVFDLLALPHVEERRDLVLDRRDFVRELGAAGAQGAQLVELRGRNRSLHRPVTFS